VARGLFSEAWLTRLHAGLQAELQQAGARLDAIYYCPHLPPAELRCEPREELRRYQIDCDCRKPRPGLLLRAAQDFALDLAACYLIGDRYRDIAAAHAAGARGVLVLTGHGRSEYVEGRVNWPRQPELIAESLLAAVRAVMKSEI
jgi:histidinol-phosphate phosphatase family protein